MADTYYVDKTTGSDSDTGLTEELAWETINKVNISSFNAGDSILFKKGETWNEKLIPPDSGSSGNPITFGAYGSGALPIIDNTAAIPGWTTGGNWTDRIGSDLATNGDFASVSATGSELVTNGSMESDSEWVPKDTPVEEQSSEQKHGGSFSWKWTTDADWEGIKTSTHFALTTGKTYFLDWWVYCITDDGLYINIGDEGANDLIVESGITGTLDDWENIVRYATSTFTDSNQHVLLAKDGSGGNGTFYADDVSLKEVTLDNWTAGTGWHPQVSSYVLTGKAEKTAGSAANLEQTGLAATASTTYKVTFTVSGRTAGSVYVEFGSTNGTSRSTNDTFIEEIVASDTDHLKIVADSSFDGAVDTVVVQLVTDLWSIESITTFPSRLWLDGTEYLEGETDSSDVDVTSRWWWDDGNDRLYVYATENPTTMYSTMVASLIAGAGWAEVFINSQSYLTFEDLTLRGGKWAVNVNTDTGNSDYLIFNGCNIGENAGQSGIWIYPGSNNSSSNGEIKNCTLDSGSTISYGFEPPTLVFGDGIGLSPGCNYWKVYNNTITDWQHVGVGISGGTDANYTSSNNEVYDNLIQIANVSYGRGFSVLGGAGRAQTNKVYLNYVKNTRTRNQIAAEYTEVYYNIIDTVTHSPQVANVGQGIELYCTADDVCNYNKIYNNVIYNTDAEAIRVTKYAGSTVTNNEVKNNILIANGNSPEAGSGDGSPHSADIGLRVSDSTDINTNTFSNNAIYNSGSATTVEYRGTDYTVANFESNLSNSDVAANNLSSDPLLTNPGSDDFTLQSTSPCRDAGVDVSLTTDYVGTTVPQGSDPDIGAYEFLDWKYTMTGKYRGS